MEIEERNKTDGKVKLNEFLKFVFLLLLVPQ